MIFSLWMIAEETMLWRTKSRRNPGWIRGGGESWSTPFSFIPPLFHNALDLHLHAHAFDIANPSNLSVVVPQLSSPSPTRPFHPIPLSSLPILLLVMPLLIAVSAAHFPCVCLFADSFVFAFSSFRENCANSLFALFAWCRPSTLQISNTHSLLPLLPLAKFRRCITGAT